MINLQNIKISCFVILTTSLLGCSTNGPQSTGETTPEISSVLTIGGTKNESANSVVKTLDGGYAVLGYTQSSDGDISNKTDNTFDYWLMKFDASGTEQWQKTYGGSEDDKGQCIIATNDGGYAIVGSSKSNNGDATSNAGFDDFWILKLSQNGDIIWEKSYGYAGADNAFSVIQSNDGGFILAGVLDVTASNGEGNNRLSTKRHAGGDYWVIKLDSSGDLIWSRYFGGSFTDTAYGVIETTDGNIIMAGSSDSNDVNISNNKGTYDFWIIKLNENGELIWDQSYGGSEIDEARDITKTIDGNFIIVGDSRSNDQNVSNNNGAADIWAIKINTEGTILWQKTYGGTGFDGVQSVYKTQDNDYIIAGNSRSTDGDLTKNNGQNDAWLLKINDQGTLQWQTSAGGSLVDLLMDVTVLNNRTIVAVGQSNSDDLDITENKGFTDLLILKIEP